MPTARPPLRSRSCPLILQLHKQSLLPASFATRSLCKHKLQVGSPESQAGRHGTEHRRLGGGVYTTPTGFEIHELRTPPCCMESWVGLLAGIWPLGLVPYNRPPELIFVALSSIIQAGAVCDGPGPSFGRKPAQNQPKLKSTFWFPNGPIQNLIPQGIA